MESAYLYITIAVVLGLYMTWGVGANDVANAMGTSVGSKAITVRKAIVIAAIFEFAGAYLAGGTVTGTIRRGIIDASALLSPELLIYGMMGSLLGAGVWLMVASRFGWPVSTTHSIVGALVGFGMVSAGPGAIAWGQVGGILASWVISPVLGGAIAFALAQSVRHFVLDAEDPDEAARRWGPVYVFLMGALISLVTVWKGLTHLDLEISTGGALFIAAGVGLVAAVVGRLLIHEVIARAAEGKSKSIFEGPERIFAPLCVFTACGMAFAHGSNDVANGIGPLAAIVSTATSGEVNQEAPLATWVLLLGGGGIVLGLSTWGYRVMRTIGRKITELTPSRGFCAELAAASTVVIASRLGLPVSTTHIIVGAVLGVGIARGVDKVNKQVVARIVTSWLVTLPVGAGLAALFFLLFRAILG